MNTFLKASLGKVAAWRSVQKRKKTKHFNTVLQKKVLFLKKTETAKADCMAATVSREGENKCIYMA